MRKRVNFDLLADQVSLEWANMRGRADNRRQRERIKRILMKVIQEQLSEKQREYLLLHYAEGKSFSQIGREKGKDNSTVCRTVQRAVSNIREKMRYCSFR